MLKSSLLALVIVCTLMSALALSATTDTSRTNSLFQFAVPVDHITIQGPLRDRLLRNYDRLERSEYEPAQVFRLDANNQQWPGDYAGRTILALANLQRITGRKSRYLDTLLAELPQHLNERGYMGAISSGIDEQQLAGNGWLVSGLLAAHEVTGNAQALAIARGIVTNLFLPTRAHFASYPCTPETRTANSGGASGTRVGTHGEWQLSTDIGCAFIMLEGLVDAYATFGGDDLKTLIDEMCTAFATIDLEGTSVQLHATLTAIRQLLHYHDLTGDPTILALAQHVYDNYRVKAMTENFANYNWYNRPTWTEPCAIVDSFIVATSLWRKTGDPSYLEDAHAIYFNALGYAQKPHGGFGCDNCVGAEEPVLFNKVYDVTWCCNMRGAVGLSHAADFTYLQMADALVLPFYFDSTALVTFPNGHMTVSETTA
ncbi:MAG TPA: hypothetical protein VHV83_19965 [Armatimonadota bacterium]|nr:hypothetical protein [Armatimonadota bacterium]